MNGIAQSEPPQTDGTGGCESARREIEIAPIAQGHPRLLINASDVAEMQNDINNQIEPRYSAWLQLKARADAWSTNAIAAPYTGDHPLEFYNNARMAGHYAAKMGLAYLLDGNAAYAEKAKEILLAWAQATPLPATEFSKTEYFPGSGMVAARGIVGLVYAYDYIYNYPGFTSAEKQRVERWFLAVLPVIQAGIDRWDACYKPDKKDPRGYSETNDPGYQYFHRQYYQNHLSAHIMGLLAIGYAIGDRSVVQFAVDSPENPRDFLEMFDGAIVMAGDPDVCHIDPQTPPPQDGEIYDRYRHVQNKGLAYAMLTLCEMTAMADILMANGVDVYSRTGKHGETLEHPFEFYADFFRLDDSTVKGEFYGGETVPSELIGIFEVANKRYPGNTEIEKLLKSVDRRRIDQGGNMGTYFCYPVLTHGVELTDGDSP